MRVELLRNLHLTLRSMNVTEPDAHTFLNWLDDEDRARDAEHARELAELRALLDETRRAWMLRTAGMFCIGLALGLVLGWRFVG